MIRDSHESTLKYRILKQYRRCSAVAGGCGHASCRNELIMMLIGAVFTCT